MSNQPSPKSKICLAQFSAKKIISAMRSAGYVLFLMGQILGTAQGSEVSAQPLNQELLLPERNGQPYTLKEIKDTLDPILDEKIKDEFWPFVEVFFDGKFPPPIHNSETVIHNWNSFFQSLNNVKYTEYVNERHPQMQVLFGNLVIHHSDIFYEKYRALYDIWLS